MDEDTQYNCISKQINFLFYYQNMQYQNIDLKILVWVTDNSSVQIRENKKMLQIIFKNEEQKMCVNMWL